MSSARTVLVDSALAARRLDVALADALALSRRYAQRLLARGDVRIDGRPASKGDTLPLGARIEIPPFRHPSEGVLASPDRPLHVIAAAHGLVAVDKPASEPCHGIDFDDADSLVSAFVARYPSARAVGIGTLEGPLVHRIDPGTSGVVVLATDAGAHGAARHAFARGDVRKEYLARVHGALAGDRRVELSLESAGTRMRVVRAGGRRAITEIRVLETDAESSLLTVTIPTGVRHQIRATLAHLGHPVVGDHTYGSSVALTGPQPRHLLHAARIELTGLHARSAPPEELRVSGAERHGTRPPSPTSGAPERDPEPPLRQLPQLRQLRQRRG